jgi:hypothetical protein
MSIPIILYDPAGLYNILLLIAFCAAIYFALMYALRTFRDEEILFFKSLIHHR